MQAFTYSLDKITLLGSVSPRTPVHCFANALYSSYVSGKACLGLEKPVVQTAETINDYRLCQYRCSSAFRIADDKEGNFYIAWGYNGSYSSQRPCPYNFKIEFNPNKSGVLIWNAFVRSVDFKIHDIPKFDVAFDIPSVSTNDIHIDTKCDVMTFGKVFNKTTYIAPKEQRSGRIKIYDKKIERADKGVVIDDTLRIEVTVRNSSLCLQNVSKLCDKDYEEIEKIVSRLNSVKWRTSSSSRDWQSFVLSKLSAQDLDVALSMMSSATRAKYRQSLNESVYTSLDLDTPTLLIICKEILRPFSCFDIFHVANDDNTPHSTKDYLASLYGGVR